MSAGLWQLAVAGVVLLAGVARAEDKKVPVQAEVVLASTKAGGGVDPSLAAMQTTLGARVKYLSMKKVSAQKLELHGAPSLVSLPNGKAAELSLLAVKENVAQVKVKVGPLDTTYSLGKEKSLFVQAGSHDGGDLWLVLSQPK
jgi:hypothetical protein